MIATNYFTGTEYHGKNAVFLRMAPFKSNEWATYKQWFEGGFQVQKGQHGQRIMKIVQDDDGDTMPKFYTVFNFEQVKRIEKEE